jgi:hypothetical protein
MFFFNWQFFFLKEKLKIPERNDFGGFQASKGRGKEIKITRFIYLIFIV